MIIGLTVSMVMDIQKETDVHLELDSTSSSTLIGASTEAILEVAELGVLLLL